MIVAADKLDKAMPQPEKPGEGGDFRLTRLFQGEGFYGNPSDRMIILKNGVEVHEVPIEQLNQDTVIGRKPKAAQGLQVLDRPHAHLPGSALRVSNNISNAIP